MTFRELNAVPAISQSPNNPIPALAGVARYQVSYDLRRQRNYDELYKALSAYGAVRILKSDWLIVSHQTASQIRDALKGSMDADDGLFVGALTGEAAWANLECSNEAAKAKLG